jgi:hypothetical protein
MGGYEEYEEYEEYGDEDEQRQGMFASPGSALRAATRDDPRDQPCPTCDRANRLTRADVSLGYQCDSCADACERGCD